MEEKVVKVKVKQEAYYKGHNVSPNGNVNLSFLSGYSQLSQTIMDLQMLNNDILIKAKIGSDKPIALGTFRIKDIKIDNDGESVLKFNSISDYVEMDMLNMLITAEPFFIMLESEIIIEPETEDNE